MTTETNLSGRLLVVDFDYFFPHPFMMEKEVPEILAYDWGSRENTFYAGPLWSSRTRAFWLNGLELPQTLPHAGFWERFNLEETAETPFVGDSNMYAGSILPETVDLEKDGWEEVWLFDAHHDSGYKRTRTLEEFEQRETMTCEDWMLNHAAKGSKLFVRYPSWRARSDGSIYECEPAPAVDVDRAIDPGGPVEGWFDAVYICRSGVWVPPWCDDAFEKFISEDFWGSMWIDEEFPRHRDWDMAAERAQFELMQQHLATMKKETQPHAK